MQFGGFLIALRGQVPDVVRSDIEPKVLRRTVRSDDLGCSLHITISLEGGAAVDANGDGVVGVNIGKLKD